MIYSKSTKYPMWWLHLSSTFTLQFLYTLTSRYLHLFGSWLPWSTPRSEHFWIKHFQEICLLLKYSFSFPQSKTDVLLACLVCCMNLCGPRWLIITAFQLMKKGNGMEPVSFLNEHTIEIELIIFGHIPLFGHGPPSSGGVNSAWLFHWLKYWDSFTKGRRMLVGDGDICYSW